MISNPIFKIIISIILCCLLFSCSSINYQLEPDKLYVDINEFFTCTTFIMNNHYDEFPKETNKFIESSSHNDYIFEFGQEKVYIKDFPKTWLKFGLFSKSINSFDGFEIGNHFQKNFSLIVIFEKSSLFGLKSKLHSAIISEIHLYSDSSFNLIIIDPEQKSESKMGYNDIIHSNYISIFALKPKYNAPDGNIQD